MKVAEELGDQEMVSKTKTLIAARQKKLREFIKSSNADKSHPILVRDYAREQVVTGNSKQRQYINNYREKELESLKKKYGHYGFPKTSQEYQRLLYNNDTGQAMHVYVQARKYHTVEPVVNYKDYIHAKQRLDKEVVGTTTSSGQVIKSYSDHTFDRIFGVRKDPNGKRRIGVSIDEMKQMLQSNRYSETPKRHSTKYISNKGYVAVNNHGKIITLVPRKDR